MSRQTVNEDYNLEEERLVRDGMEMAVLMALLPGGIFLMAGLLNLQLYGLEGPRNDAKAPSLMPPLLAAAFALVGLAGVLCGGAILLGNHASARLIYITATIYLALFPFGLFTWLFVWQYLPRYFDYVERRRKLKNQPSHHDAENHN
ncbi:MAG: hypothetical protein NZ703_00310 [Gemmataceae bacterium]|nr:hypothetical protein [Gemmataceae bacterium]MCS7269504.1 hypothetical protein [Gemmataceae bacterium]MDW8242827.1 hypothetical protein [Thermogemmata sp.]